MVRDGQLVCRFYTYGSQLDSYLDPQHVRKLTDEEREAGLTGPDKAIGQDDIDVALGREPRRPRGERGQQQQRGGPPDRRDLYSSMRGARGGQRNRREDRVSRGYGDRGGYDRDEERGNWKEVRGSDDVSLCY